MTIRKLISKADAMQNRRVARAAIANNADVAHLYAILALAAQYAPMRQIHDEVFRAAGEGNRVRLF